MIYHCNLEEWKFKEKVEDIVSNSHGKTEYVVHIRNLRQVLNRGLVLKNVHTVIKFNQNTWLKPYIDMNTKLKFSESSFQADKWCSFRKNYGKCEKTEILNL